MNRRQKIIVSVVGIFIVLLALVGITYGYFLTRIQGNTNTTSITVTTADLKLVYGDGNEAIESASVLMPGEDFKFIGRDAQGNVLTDTNGDIIEYDSKTFSVTNEGNATVEDYAVVLEDISVTYASNATLEDGTTVTAGQTTTFDRPQDFVYILTCTSTDGNNCNGQEETILPMQDSILVTNTIDKDVTHNYELKIKYLDPNVDQSKDMNKTFKMKVNIYNFSHYNPYSDNIDSLAYNIINNSISKTNGTELLAQPRTKVAEEGSTLIDKGLYNGEATSEDGFSQWNYMCYGDSNEFPSTLISSLGLTNDVEICNELKNKYISDCSCMYECQKLGKVLGCTTEGKPIIEKMSRGYEQELSIALDDYGMSYYYRGMVEDNYVNFADMCWRIVRINGDGSIKLILEDQDQLCDSKDSSNNYIMDSNWNIKNSGVISFGYSAYAAGELTASDGTTNSRVVEILEYFDGKNNDEYYNVVPMVTVLQDFQETFTANELLKLKSGNWCLGDVAYASSTDNSTPLTKTEILDYKIKGQKFYYDSYVRLTGKEIKEPTLKCNGTILNKFGDNTTDMFVGAITADEATYAGALMGDYAWDRRENYLGSNNGDYYWTLTPYDSINAVVGTVNGSFYADGITGNIANFPTIRPTINLASNVEIIKGTGLLTDPYVIG